MSGFTKRVLASILSILILSGIFPGYSGLYCQASVTQNSYQVGDIIEFGSYPQTQVTNTDLIETLNSLDKEWLGCPYQRRYHRAFMYYADVEYNTEKYRAILIETFRESSADKYPGAKSSVYDQMQNSYSTSVVYWFRYEPLQWKILDPESGLAICQTIIDSQPFSYEDTDNYLDSSVRSWLNDSFCETAFADSQKQALQYMNIPDETSAVKERVTLLDKSQLSVSDYKLNTDASRMAVGTDYAKCQGLYVNTNGYSQWLLEDSPEYYILQTGKIGSTGNIYSTYLGIRPAISIDFNNPVIQTNQIINISDEKIYLTPGEKKQLTIDVASSDISEKETWTSNDASIATVSDSGMVTAMNIGETDVTVSINNTVVRCTVTVTAEEFVPAGWVGIYTIEDLNNIRNKPNNNYRLMADLDLSEATAEGGAYDVNGCGWKAIPYIRGNFDGNGHIIKGLRTSGDAKSGLFETVYGNITNLKMYNIHVSIDDASFAGIVANQIIEGTVSNVVVSDFELTVENAYATAGSSTFENSAQTFTGIGGIIGAAAKSRIENCSVSGNININGASAKTTVSCGGIVGYACNTISIFCYTDGDITVKLSTSKTDANGANVGGIAGCSLYSSDYTIPVYCYNDINITCTAYSVREGGILGKCPGSTGPQYCVNAGTIFGRFEFNGMAGGIAGWESGAQNSLNIGQVSMNASITATPKISGIAPYDKKYIFSCVDLTPFDGASGVSKYSESTYYICENEENTDDNALTPEEMKYEENFPKLDFNNIWFIDLSTGVEHPQLMRLPVKNEIPALIIDIHESAKSIDVGTEFNLDPTVSPSNAEEQLFYSSSDTSVATVSDDGVVKALSPGWALITVTTASGTKTQCKLTVNDHKFDQQTIITPATCSDTGYAEQICKTCGLILHQELPIDPDAHDWDEWFVETAPTCSSGGVEKRICKHNPAHVETRDIAIDPYAHKAETFYTIDVKADCENDGSKSHHCEYCDAILDSMVIPARGHDLTSVTTSSTCSEAGEIVYTCSHTDSTDEYEACSYTYTEPIAIDSDAHDWGEWFVETAPTCSVVGVEKRICKRNPAHIETRNIAIDPDAHKAETFYTVDVKAVCVNNGSKSHHCEYCDAILDSVVIPARGHVYDDGVVTKNATCTENGVKTYTCTHTATDEYNACTHSYTEEIPALGHEFGDWYTVTEATATQEGLERRDCIRGDAYEERTIPKKRPVNDNEAIETEKTAEFDETTGNTTIHLKAWSEANKIVAISKMGVPLDIVLIVDQSGSMEGRKLSALKNAASDFADVVYENAAANNVDHRIAIVGFAMGSYTQDEKAYPPYLNSEILTTGGAPIRYSTNLTKENYRDALVSVNDSDALNPVITKAIGNIEAKGATAADVGLTMANNIFAANPIDGTGRLRVVVFLTDGEPTNYSGYQKDVANAAIRQSSMLKNTYGALVYSVGVESNTDMTDRFLNYVSSNYPNAVNMDNGGAKDKNGGYYISVNDTAELSNIFREIATESISYTSDFTDLTLIDTVSDAFTLTTQQEFELRKNAIESLGIHNDDITVTRNENGMTTIQIDHVVPRQVTENLTVKYVAEFSFTVTADEDALKKGVYITNTDDAGVSMDGGATFEKTFEVPEITVSSDRGVAIFTINGEPFHITTVKIGDEVKAPAYTVDSGYTFSGWNIEDGYTLSGGSVTFDAVQTGEHEHHYAKIVVAQATCARHGETEYICECGDSYTETVPATGAHQWVAIRGAAAAEKLSNEEFRCEVCGDMMEKSLTYIITGTKTGRKGQTTAVEEELNLTNASGDLSQPGTTVTITTSVHAYFVTQKVSDVRVYRVEDDGTRTLLPSTYANNMVTFETDHFCTYIFEAVYECEETGKHTDADADGYCDDCDTEIPQLSEWEKFRCKMCPTYERLKDTPVVGVIVTIVHFFVHLSHYISYLT